MSEERLLVTFDEDFGDLVYRRGRSASCGIVLFRITTKLPADATRRIVALLESRDDWNGAFAVIDENGIRIRSLPSA